MNGIATQLKNYEYRVRATPEYTADIREDWELVNVFLTYLSNGHINYIIVFRRELVKLTQGEKG